MVSQSTHPRGARRSRFAVAPATAISFNPRAHGGATYMHERGQVIGYVFQSTRPRGARQLTTLTQSRYGRFQSTRPRGARHQFFADWDYEQWFQSTRPRGARQNHLAVLANTIQFQSTRPRGARLAATCAASSGICFNPRAHVGRDGERGQLRGY